MWRRRRCSHKKNWLAGWLAGQIRNQCLWGAHTFTCLRHPSPLILRPNGCFLISQRASPRAPRRWSGGGCQNNGAAKERKGQRKITFPIQNTEWACPRFFMAKWGTTHNNNHHHQRLRLPVVENSQVRKGKCQQTTPSRM